MFETPRAATPSHLPWFITEPGQTDRLMVFMGIFLLFFVAIVAVLMMRLLYLPLTMVSQEEKAKYEVVGTLCLLAMFAPGNFLWIAALLVAMMDVPDPTIVFNRMADAMRRISETRAARKWKPLKNSEYPSAEKPEPTELRKRSGSV